MVGHPGEPNPAGLRQCREVGTPVGGLILWPKSAIQPESRSAAERPREARLHIQRHNARGSEGGRGRGGLAYRFEAPTPFCAAPCRDQAQRRRSAQVGNCSRIDVRPAKGGPRSARGRQTARDSASRHGRGRLRPAEGRAAPARWACDLAHVPPTAAGGRSHRSFGVKRLQGRGGLFPVTVRGPNRAWQSQRQSPERPQCSERERPLEHVSFSPFLFH